MWQNQVPIFSGGTHLHPGLKEPTEKVPRYEFVAKTHTQKNRKQVNIQNIFKNEVPEKQ